MFSGNFGEFKILHYFQNIFIDTAEKRKIKDIKGYSTRNSFEYTELCAKRHPEQKQILLFLQILGEFQRCVNKILKF